MDSHPERFAGLHVVARALIDHLATAYDVEVHEDPVHARDLLIEVRDVLHAVRVTPRRSGAAPLTFVLTGYPGVVVHAGVLHDFPFPVCGCDACDETAETTADRMERLVLSVAAGGYAERYPVGSRRWSEYALTRVRRLGLGKRQWRTRPRRPRPTPRRRDPAAGCSWPVESVAAARELNVDGGGAPPSSYFFGSTGGLTKAGPVRRRALLET